MGKRGRVKRIVVTNARDRRREAARKAQGVPVEGSSVVPNRELDGQVALLNLLTLTKRDLQATEKALTKYVRQARRAGITWREIGQAVGVTQQSATSKWGPYPVDKSKPSPKPGRSSIPKAQPTPTTRTGDAPPGSKLTQGAS